MKIKLLSFLMLFSITQTLKSQTTLTAGDIAIIGYNADEVGNEDEFSFILLTDIVTGTVINFTDFGWCSDINGFQSANACGASTGSLSDGALSWTSSSNLSCGTQIHIVCGGTSLSASIGTVSGLQVVFNFPGEYMSLAVGGDQIFAFQGTLTTPTLITGIGMNGAWDASLLQCALTSTQSSFPAALSSSNSMNITPEVDNARYNSVDTANSPTNLRTAILNSANWNVNDATPFVLPISNSFACAAIPLPVVWISQPKLIKTNSNVIINWSVASQINNSKFVIEHSKDGSTFIAVGEIIVENEISYEKKYSFTHLKPSFGANFYRIKQIDIDGKFSYSNIVNVNFNFDKQLIDIYPNPAHDEVTIEVADDTEITIIDLMGKVLKVQTITKENMKLDVSDLVEGIYLIKFENDQNIRLFKN